MHTGTRERHLESVLQSALRQLIPVKNFPRSLIQITLQVTGLPENEYTTGKVTQYNIVSADIVTRWAASRAQCSDETHGLRMAVLILVLQ